MVVICLLMLPFLSVAQSDYNDTSTLNEVELENDTSFSMLDTNSDTVISRSTPDSDVLRLQQLKEFAYANDPAYWKKRKNENTTEVTGYFFSFFSYFLIAVFVVGFIYVLFKILTENKILLFKRKNKTSSGMHEEEEVESTTDLSTLIKEAESNQQFRLATRYRYLQLLQQLQERQLIKMHGELTNWDYVNQMKSHPLVSKFTYLTYAYEYAWYGEFDLNEGQYEVLRNRFKNFLG